VVNGVTATFVTARAAARQMVTQGSGVILALNSGSSHGSPMMGSTGLADSAIDTFVRNLAQEIGPRGVRVLGMWIAGVPETLTKEKLSEVDESFADEAKVRGVIEHLDGLRMLRKSPSLEHVAELAAFLANDRSWAVTGSFVNATGMFPH
jgi:enoyl-[acyl-carrier-protein] reductase (NADH)